MNSLVVIVAGVLFLAGPALAAPSTVAESAREIPVAYSVDVAVVGGTTGAVSAAEAAAKKGASVFLAAPRPYLGEDVCGTLRLWLAADEEPTDPLARRIFSPAAGPAPTPKGAAFRYEADKPSASPHRDTRKGSLLHDGRAGSAARESVQYAGDVTIVADLGKSRKLRAVHVLAYQREADFEVRRVVVSTSTDRKAWKPTATIPNRMLDKGGFEQTPINLSAAVTGSARYVRFAVEKTDRVQRVLLGEIVIETDESAKSARPPKAAKPAVRVTTPMQVKATLDEALLAAGVKFLYGCYATDVLRDGDGKPAGIVMANRAGRQAVVAKVIVDATDRATVARLAGATFRPYPAGKQPFERVVIGGQPRSGQGLTVRRADLAVPRARDGRGSGARSLIQYALALPMADGSFAAFAQAEQAARDLTFDAGQVGQAEVLFQVPPDPMKARKAGAGAWPGAGGVDLEALRPAGVERLYVLGGRADVPRDWAAKLLRPPALMAAGRRVGEAAAAEARGLARPMGVTLPAAGRPPAAAGDVREFLAGVRPTQKLPKIASAARALPVLGRYDVVVIGGGTGGAPAGIAAARRGARTLVVEYLHGLGGVGTLGLIGKYYHGYRGGFTAEVDRGVASVGGGRPSAGWNIQWKMHWWRRELRKAGAEIWFGCLGCGAYVADGKVLGAVVATPAGRGVVLAKVVVDSTGNADVAAAAGAPCIYTDGSFVAVQGTGLPPKALGASYTNTDYTFTDETDMLDVWALFVSARRKYRGAFDLGQLIDTRERRRIRGELVLNIMDPITERTYSDTIAMSKSDFDTHGYTVHPYFLLAHPQRLRLTTYVPYRALLPRGLDGILVTGLGISAHRDTVPLIRMQPDIQNHGYAAGAAAAMAAKTAGSTRSVDVRALQRHLVETGNLPKAVLAHADNHPLPTDKVEEAVRNLRGSAVNVAVLMSHQAQGLPLVRQAYEAAAPGPDKIYYAQVLAVCGDKAGLAPLVSAVEAAQRWDKGWNFRGMGQYGSSLSPLDRLIFSLGMAGDRKAVPAILAKAELLDAGQAFSHHRTVARALEMLRDPAAAEPLAKLLSKPQMTGYAVRRVDPSGPAMPHAGNEARSRSLRELILAAALFRCGDRDGLGRKILTEYADDLRGHYARFARAVLREGGR